METTYERSLNSLVRKKYTQKDIENLKEYLSMQGTFDFEVYRSGLYPATPCKEHEEGRYRYAWVRDNVHLAYAFVRSGRSTEALAIATALVNYFDAHAERFDSVIEGRADKDNPMNRPHVRIDGEELQEISETWAHAQNDAHGLFLWITGTLVHEGLLDVDSKLLKTVSRTVRFLNAIHFYEDTDSGVWEEERAVHASSIGAVCAGLLAWRDELHNYDHTLSHSTGHAYEEGMQALNDILPNEVTQGEGEREYDSALLFLVEPLHIVSGEQAEELVLRIRANLMGERGICRYKKDAFWGPDYDRLSASLRTSDASEDMSFRAEYAVSDKEAQWTLFDPLLAMYYARRYKTTGNENDAELSAVHLNRTLAMLVRTEEGKLLLPELYYYKEGVLTENTIVPLYWAEANVLLALSEMASIESHE